MGGFSVRPTSLDTASSKLNSSRASLDSARRGLTDYGAAGMSAGSLDAAAAFEGMVSAWAGALDRLSASLDDLAQNTAAAAAIYEQTDLKAVPEPDPAECPPSSDPLELLLAPGCTA